MSIELAGVKLERIHKIDSCEHSDFVYHDIIGRHGSLAQNLGRGSVYLKIEGICYGENAKKDVEKIRNFYNKREPLDFIADIVGTSYVTKVLINSLYVTESAEEPQQFSYSLLITEHVESGQKSAADKAAAKVAVDKNIKTDAKKMFEIEKLPTDLAFGSIPEISDPFEPLDGSMTPV